MTHAVTLRNQVLRDRQKRASLSLRRRSVRLAAPMHARVWLSTKSSQFATFTRLLRSNVHCDPRAPFLRASASTVGLDADANAFKLYSGRKRVIRYASSASDR